MRKLAGLVALCVCLAGVQLVHAQVLEGNERITLQRDIGRHLDAARYKEVQPLVERLLRSDEARYGKQHAILLQTLWTYASVLHKNHGNVDAVKPTAARIEEILKVVNDSNDPEQLELAARFMKSPMGRKEAAAEYYSMVANLMLDQPDRDQLHLSVVLTEMAQLDYDTQNHERAQQAAEMALSLQTELLGPEHKDQASNARILGALYAAQGKAREAETMLRRVVAMETRFRPTRHPGILDSQIQLAAFLGAQKRHDEAIRTLRSVIHDFSRHNYGMAKVTDRKLVKPQALLARMYVKTGAFDDAVASLRTAWVNEASHHEKEPVDVAVTQWLIASGFVGEASRRELSDAELSRLADTMYATDLAHASEQRSDKVEPDVAYALWTELLARAEAEPQGPRRNIAISEALNKLLSVREKHWPANDAERRRLKQRLAQHQAAVAKR